jgi:hypothetical protein
MKALELTVSSTVLSLVLSISCNILSAQMSSKSKIHQPSSYTAPFNMQLFERAYSSGNVNSTPVSNAGIAVIQRYNQVKSFPTQLSEGWHNVYAIARNNNTPVYCYSALASIIKKTDGERTSNYISDLKIDNQVIDFELSEEVVKCKTNVLWKCGTNEDYLASYCGFEIYFLDDLEQYNSSFDKTSFLYTAIGLSENEIANHYNINNQFQIRRKHNDAGARMVEVQNLYLNLTYYLLNDRCYFVQIMPNRKEYVESLTKLNDGLYQSVGEGLWIVKKNPIQYFERIGNKERDYFAVYGGDFRAELLHARQTSSSNDVKSSKTNDTPVYGDGEFYNGRQIVSFAKQVNFKPRSYKLQEWEDAVLKVFLTNSNSTETSKQINIEAMYECSTKSDTMFNRYTELYGNISRTTFDKYCRLFIILLKTDAISRN